MAAQPTTEPSPRARPVELLTPDEVGEICKVNTRTVNRWIREGDLLVRRFGPRIVRVEPDELDRFIGRRRDRRTRRSAS